MNTCRGTPLPALAVSVPRMAFPLAAVVGCRARLSNWPLVPLTSKTAKVEPSFERMSFTARGRSSSRLRPLGAVSLPVPLVPVNHWPVASSLMVPMPVAAPPAVTVPVELIVASTAPV